MSRTGASAARHILVGSLRRSGGTLVGRLFDGHPQCSTFPFEYWHTRKKALFRRRHNLAFRLLSAKSKLRVCGLERGSYRRKISRHHPDVDWEIHRGQLLEAAAQSGSVSALYERVSTLYFRGLRGGEVHSLVVNHCADLCKFSPWQLRRTFGEYTLVMSIRDPRAAFWSLLHHRPHRHAPEILAAFCRDWKRSVERCHLSDAGVVSFRFEDLVSEPAKVMRGVCASLEIAFDPILLVPTQMGAPVPTNSSFGRGTGIDPSTIDSWRSRLGSPEREFIEHRLGSLMQRVGYV